VENSIPRLAVPKLTSPQVWRWVAILLLAVVVPFARLLTRGERPL